MLDTTNWALFPFTVKGINFVSKLDTHGSFYPQVIKMPSEMVATMNSQAILELIGDVSLLTNEELSEELDRINDGATQAILALA